MLEVERNYYQRWDPNVDIHQDLAHAKELYIKKFGDEAWIRGAADEDRNDSPVKSGVVGGAQKVSKKNTNVRRNKAFFEQTRKRQNSDSGWAIKFQEPTTMTATEEEDACG